MKLRAVDPIGTDYLALVTDLAQRRRLADPTGGLWEAADLQWWWTRDVHDDPRWQRVWLDGDVPVAATIVSRWNDRRAGCDVISDPGLTEPWEFAADRCADLDREVIEMFLAEDDPTGQRAATDAGFASTDEGDTTCWRDDPQPDVPPLPDGYELHSRRDRPEPEHPMARRNGPLVEDRLRQCSLYDPDLDLAVWTAAGEPAGYALFWADPRTGVGLVEPVRVEEEHERRGLARHLVAAGVARLIGHGCTRLKVSYESEVAGHVYRSAGFVPESTARLYRYDRP